MASLGHPVAGDDLYGGRARQPPLPVSLQGLALHAAELAFVHPITETRLQFASPLPLRMERLLSQLPPQSPCEMDVLDLAWRSQPDARMKGTACKD